MADRQVKVTLVIDKTGAVSALKTTASESEKTEGKFKHLDTQVKGLGKSFGGLKTMIGAGLGALGVTGVAYGVKDIVGSTEELGKAVEKFHAVSGIGARQSLDITAALKARGVSPEVIGKSFGFLNKNLQTAERQWHTYGAAQLKASETGKVSTSLLGVQATAFKELGVNIGALAGQTGEQKLQTVVQAFEHLPPALRRSGEAGRLMKQIFGRGGEGLATVLQGGALGLTAMTKAAKEFFPTLNVKSLEELHQQTAYSNLAFEGLKFTLGQQLIPVILGVDKWFVKTISEVEKGHGIWGVLYHDIRSIVETLGGLKNVLVGVGAVWGIGKVLAFAGALKSLSIIGGISTAIKFLAGGDVLLTLQVAALDAAGGVTALGASLAGLLVYAAPIAALAAAVYGLDKVLPAGNRPENLLGGKQPGEATREGQAGNFKQRLQRIAQSQHYHAPAPAAGGHAKVDLHLDGKKVGEALVRNPAAARILAEGTAHYTSKMAARK